MTTHPLERYVQNAQPGSLPVTADQTPENFPAGFLPSRLSALKSTVRRRLYPLKNRLQRRSSLALLETIGAGTLPGPTPDLVCLGPRGFDIEISLSQMRRVVGRPEAVLCFGCGSGYEVLQIADTLRPRLIVGVDFFSHARAWAFVAARVKESHGVEAQFHQLDLRVPGATDFLPCFDLAFSHNVLEHLQELEDNFAAIRRLLRPGGFFTSQWGPMWHCYSGDHIGAELSFDAGFEHVRLPADKYLAHYKAHPRNRETVARGEPTWLELGLHNYRRYPEYLRAVEQHFGPVRWLKWLLAKEAFRWRDRHPDTWRTILADHPELDPLDLALNGISLVASVA